MRVIRVYECQLPFPTPRGRGNQYGWRDLMFPKVALHINGSARIGSLVGCKKKSRQNKCSQEDADQSTSTGFFPAGWKPASVTRIILKGLILPSSLLLPHL